MPLRSGGMWMCLMKLLYVIHAFIWKNQFLRYKIKRYNKNQIEFNREVHVLFLKKRKSTQVAEYSAQHISEQIKKMYFLYNH